VSHENHDGRHRAALTALAEMVRERARFTAPAVFALLAAYLVAFRPLGVALPVRIYFFDVAVLAVLGLLSLAIFLRWIPLRWAHVASAATLWCPLLATIVPFWATHNEVFATLYVMQLVYAGILLGRRWLVITLVVANAAAIAILLDVGGPHTALLVSCVVSASLLASLVHVLLWRAFYNAEVLRFEFRSLVESSPDAMYVFGDAASGYSISWVNGALVRMLDYDHPGDLLGKRSVDTFLHPDDRARLVEHRAAVQRGERPSGIDVRWVRRDGATVHVHAESRPVTFAGGAAWLVVARDMTAARERERERAVAEAAIRKSEERHRVLFDGSPLPICVFDAETHAFIAVNAKMVEVYGYARAELMAMTVKDLAAPDGVRHRRKDGALLDVDITAHELEIEGRRCVLSIGSDVTAARRVEEQLRQAARMEAIGQLAGGVAHDFNNLLAAILSNASIVAEELGEGHALRPEMDDIESATRRASALTRQLLAFSRKQPRTVNDLALNTIVTNLETMLSRLVGEDIEMRAVLAPRLGTVQADAAQLEQVLLNLVVNARDAMPGGGRLVLETANVELDDARAAEVGARRGRHVMLTVTDTGCGMTAETRARVFEPFFTTKPVGKGTGLGLATVFGIVKQADGGISVESEVGRGSTFRIYLPRVDDARVAVAADPGRPVPRRGSETILVVEDDPFVRSAVLRQLRALGYRLLDAPDPATALQVAAAFPEPIHLLLTDLVMPGMDGRMLARELLAVRPTTKVLYMSGYTEHVAVRSTTFDPGDRLLEKPFTAIALADAIREVLERDHRAGAAVAAAS
jgi:two-component system cell cycle sensor histidine kinase/response regulator CckA